MISRTVKAALKMTSKSLHRVVSNYSATLITICHGFPQLHGKCQDIIRKEDGPSSQSAEASPSQLTEATPNLLGSTPSILLRKGHIARWDYSSTSRSRPWSQHVKAFSQDYNTVYVSISKVTVHMVTLTISS